MAEPPNPWAPLFLSEIERQPKKVVEDEFFRIRKKLKDSEEEDYFDIYQRIEQGKSLGKFYRRSKGFDTLLSIRGIMHLHLGHSGSDTLLYLMQYPKHVLFLCIDTHVHMEDRPIGKKFNLIGIRRFQTRLRSAD